MYTKNINYSAYMLVVLVPICLLCLCLYACCACAYMLVVLVPICLWCLYACCACAYMLVVLVLVPIWCLWLGGRGGRGGCGRGYTYLIILFKSLNVKILILQQ